jgi:hypothetical protein
MALIRGNAVRSTGTALSRTVVRLRDIRFGRIVGSQMSGPSGEFAFQSVDPGLYIVEIVGDNDVVLAATQPVNVSAGESVVTAVRLPFRAAPLGGLLGDSAPPAAIIAAEAAAAGVLTTTTTEPASPTQ